MSIFDKFTKAFEGWLEEKPTPLTEEEKKKVRAKFPNVSDQASMDVLFQIAQFQKLLIKICHSANSDSIRVSEKIRDKIKTCVQGLSQKEIEVNPNVSLIEEPIKQDTKLDINSTKPRKV